MGQKQPAMARLALRSAAVALQLIGVLRLPIEIQHHHQLCSCPQAARDAHCMRAPICNSSSSSSTHTGLTPLLLPHPYAAFVWLLLHTQASRQLLPRPQQPHQQQQQRQQQSRQRQLMPSARPAAMRSLSSFVCTRVSRSRCFPLRAELSSVNTQQPQDALCAWRLTESVWLLLLTPPEHTACCLLHCCTASGANLVPLYRRIFSDQLTPVQAYRWGEQGGFGEQQQRTQLSGRLPPAVGHASPSFR
jgi:hypothetical protein